jgi:hypothetical protein
MTDPTDPYRKHRCFLGIIQTAWYRIHGQDHRHPCPLLRFKGSAKIDKDLLAHRRTLGIGHVPELGKFYSRIKIGSG